MVMMLVEAFSARRDARLQFALAQLEMAKARLPGNRVILSPEERARLMKLGAEIGHHVDDLISIVSVKTYKRWLRDQASGKQARPVGRRRTVTPSLRALIRRLACDNPGWGTRRIFGELNKLGLSVSRSTLRRVMVDEGVLPDPDYRVPKGQPTPWRTFIDAHANVMVATDFFCKAVWSPVGKRFAYVLVFIHLGTRKVSLSPATFHPTNEWVQQQARNTLMWLEDEGLDCQFVIHDHDTKFTKAFDQLFLQVGARTIDIPYEAPIANCYAESWIGTVRQVAHFGLAVSEG
jgi:putative transposase